MPETRRVHLVASGHVQGVFFRASARDEAVRLGLSGWVRNLPDGRVEAEAQGPRAAVERFVTFCRSGPGTAVVEALELTELPPLLDDPGFAVRPTPRDQGP